METETEKVREKLRKDKIPHLGIGNCPNKYKSNWSGSKVSKRCSETQADQNQKCEAVLEV